MWASRRATDRAGNSRRALEESAFQEVVFVDDGSCFGRKLSPFLQQSFDIFPDQVRFEVDLIADLLEAQGRDLRRVWNNRDGEATIGHLIDRQTDTIDSNGPLHNTMAQNLR